MGNYTGKMTLARLWAKIKSLFNNTVLYSEAQTLTDAQKEQARENIGAVGECNLTKQSDGTYNADNIISLGTPQNIPVPTAAGDVETVNDMLPAKHAYNTLLAIAKKATIAVDIEGTVQSFTIPIPSNAKKTDFVYWKANASVDGCALPTDILLTSGTGQQFWLAQAQLWASVSGGFGEDYFMLSLTVSGKHSCRMGGTLYFFEKDAQFIRKAEGGSYYLSDNPYDFTSPGIKLNGKQTLALMAESTPPIITIDAESEAVLAVGQWLNIKAKNAIVAGYRNKLEGSGNFVFGTTNNVTGAAMGAIGSNLNAKNNNEIAIGKGNSSGEKTIFSIGCGYSSEQTANALEVQDTNGLGIGNKIIIGNGYTESADDGVGVEIKGNAKCSGRITVSEYATMAGNELMTFADFESLLPYGRYGDMTGCALTPDMGQEGMFEAVQKTQMLKNLGLTTVKANLPLADGTTVTVDVVVKQQE